ncbi:MAG: patatin-like phospholipase family protein [Gemmataceae bacterium]
MPPIWTPAETRKKYNLNLSRHDLSKIEQAMAPLPRVEGLWNCDAVFEGGGVLGIAFLGAVRCLSELGVRFHGLAGTSAGALTATLLAADLNVDQLEQILGQVDFLDFLKQKTSSLIFNGDPSNDLEYPVVMIANLALVGELGQYSTEPLRDWLDEILKWAGKPTFADIWERSRHTRERQLKVVVSDVTRGEMKVLPDDLESTRNPSAATVGTPNRGTLSPRQKTFAVAEAVRLSMSIPFFFLPGQLDHPTEGRSTIVDGGILSNFPLWIFDETNPSMPPSHPTFGFRLIDREADAPRRVNNVSDLFSAMFKTMMLASDRRFLSQRHQGRVIDIDLTGLNITATQFGLSNDQKDQLYARGYQATREFFLTRWNWRKHREARGFPFPPLPPGQ